MNLFQKIMSGISRKSLAFSGSARNLSMVLLNRLNGDYASKVVIRDSSIAEACIQWMCRTFPEAPVRVMRKDKDGIDIEDVESRMSELISNPNPRYSSEMLWRATIADRTADGNAYWIKERNAYGAPIGLWWAPSWTMLPWVDTETGFIDHYQYQPLGLGRIKNYDPSDIVHFRYDQDPDNPSMGLSPFRSLLRELYTDDEAARFSAALLKNMGVPGVIIVPEADGTEVTPGEAEAIKTNFKQKFGGDNRGEPMIMTRKVSVTTLSFNPQQLDLSALRAVPEERVSSVLGIPAAVVGFGSGLAQTKVGATMREMVEMSWENCIIPNQRVIAGDLKTQLLPDFGDVKRTRVDFDLRNVRALQEDQDALHKRLATDVAGGFMKISEARRAVGLPYDASDEVYLRPANMLEVKPGEAGRTVNTPVSGTIQVNP